MNLGSVAVGKKASVVKITGEASLKKRLLDMGLTPGCSVEVIRTAPLGDPVEVRVRGYCLSLRKEEAQAVGVSA